jgi:hypothetical protein
MAATVNEVYTWNLNVKKGSSNEQNVKVVVWDADSATAIISELTDVDGNITEQEVISAVHSITDTDTVATDDKTPHIISCLKYTLFPLPLIISFLAARTDTFFVSTDPYITQTNKATVAAYTGITINHTTDTITISEAHTWAEIYDYCQNEAYDSPQKDFPGGILRTSDGQNYICEYDLVVNNVVLNGQNKLVSMASGKTLTLQSAGRADDLAVTSGNVNWATATTMDNFDVSDTLYFTENVTIDVTDSQIGTVDTEAGETVVLNLLGDSSVTTNNDPTNITINNSVILQITVKDKDDLPIETAQCAIFKTSDGTQLMNEDSNSSGIASESYNYLSDTDIYYRVRKSSPGDTRYVSVGGVGTITSGGFAVTVVLREDTNV